MKLREGLIGLFAILMITITPLSLKAQVGYAPSKSLAKLEQSKTLVVLTGDEKYDKILKEAVSQYWDVNDFTFVSEEQLNKSLLLKGYFILMHQNNKTSRASFSSPETMILFTSGQSINKLSNENIYAQTTIGYSSQNKERVALQIKSIKSILNLITENDINSEHKMIVQTQIKHINSKSTQLKKGTILIDKTFISSEVEMAKLNSIYPNKIKVLSNKEINEILDRKEDGYFLLMSSNVAKTVIYNSLTGEAVYASISVRKENSQQLKIEDFQELADTVKK